MSTNTTTQETPAPSPKRYEVYNGKEKVHECQRKDSAIKKVVELQKEKVPLILLKDTKKEKQITYSKTRNENNYRVR